jgi:hypothetical protein
MTQQALTASELALRIINRNQKKIVEEKTTTVTSHVRSFDLRQHVETVYQDTLSAFKKALETMPEYLSHEQARVQWKDLHNLEHARIRNEALKTYTAACQELPEWQTYFAALKRRYEVVNLGIMT